MKLVHLIVIALVTPAFLVAQVQAQDDVDDEKSPPDVPVIEAGLQAEREAINREDSAASYGEPIIGGNGGIGPGPNYGVPPRLQVQPISGGYGLPRTFPATGGQITIRQPTQGYGVPPPPFLSSGVTGGYGGSPQIQPVYNTPISSSYGVPSFRSTQNFYRPPTVGFGSINTINYPRFIHGGNGGGGYSGGGGYFGGGGYSGGYAGQGGFNFQRNYNFRPAVTRYVAPAVVSGGYS